MNDERTASVGVDVDAIKYYFQIHGLESSNAPDAAWSIGVPRFLDLFRQVGCLATFYCVASDLEDDIARATIKDIVAEGHEVGNHTLDHHYGLTELSAADIYEQVATSRVKLERYSESPVVGFRAPGYHLNGTVLRAVKASGHLYDTSVFPCVPYYIAKAGIMGLMQMQGRDSKSLLGHPQCLLASRRPYLASFENPYRAVRENGIDEFPISVFGGVPLIGTAFTAMGRLVSTEVAAAAMRWHSHLTLEFHAADLLSLDEDGLPPQLSVQPDLRVSWTRKYDIFASVLNRLAEKVNFRRLADVVGDAR